MRKQLRMLLMMLALVLILVPVIAFADDEGVSQASLSYDGADIHYYPDYSGYDNIEGLYEVGNKIVVTINGVTKTYIYEEYKNEEGYTMEGFFLNGEKSDNWEYFWVDNSGSIPAGTEKLTITGEVYDEKTGEWIRVNGEVRASAVPEPKSLSYEGVKLQYRDEGYVNGFNTVGNKIILTYDNGDKDIYVCESYKENGNSLTDYFLNGDTKSVEDEFGQISFPYRERFELEQPVYGGIKAGTTKLPLSMWYDYGGVYNIKLTSDVAVSEYVKPVSAKFSGKTLPVYIGDKPVWLNALCVDGNTIIITYSNNKTATYKCISFKKGKDTYTGFFRDGNKQNDELFGAANIKVKKGNNSVTFDLSVNYEDYIYSLKLKNIMLTATKLHTYSIGESCGYTGKVIKPKIIVKDGNGKTVPEKYYTVKYLNAKDKYVKKPYGKKFGHYSYRVTFKKAYKNKYRNPVYGGYLIMPKTPKISSVTAGKGKFTIKWKKVKGNVRYKIKYSTNKGFYNSMEWVNVPKGKTSCTVKGLEKGKTYYVVVHAIYRGGASDGEDDIWSDPSKVKSVKIN